MMRLLKENMMRRHSRRGTVIVAVIVFVLIAEFAVLGLMINTSNDQYVAAERLSTIRAFYAAEGGMNMAIREMMLSSDEDGDGTIGAISDDGNHANDPTFGNGSVFVTATSTMAGTALSSLGSSAEAERLLSATVSTN